MEPIDGDNYLREVALSLAVQFSHERPGYTSGLVLDVANQFLYWLERDR